MSSLIAPEPATYSISPPAVPARDRSGTSTSWRAVASGFLVALAQLVIAVGLLAPDLSWSRRYESLIQHDSFWFKNIMERGYGTSVPPVTHRMMQVSNVGFFPAYPLVAAGLQAALHVKTGTALLLTAQLAAWGFWSYFFLFCARWNVPPTLRFLGALGIAAHPAAFFLIAGYSESLFLMGLLGFAYWSGSSARGATFWAALHGAGMSATRLVGIPCAAFPLIQSAGLRGLREPVAWIRRHGRAIVLTAAGVSGALLFSGYCLLRWGHWDMYMLTQTSCWGLKPDYLAVFKPGSYRWHWPDASYPTEGSQIAMTLGALFLVGLLLSEFIAAWRRDTNWRARVGWYFCGAVIYYVSVSGVARVGMESMLRYAFCPHVLIVLALLHFLRQFRNPPGWARVTAMTLTIVACAAGLCAQAWCLWNFMRGNWVA